MVSDKYDSGVKIIAQASVAIYTMRFREDGILHGHVSKGRWTPEDYKLLFPVIGRMVDLKKVPVLFTYDKKVFPTSESSAYWANPETACPYFSAEAFLMDTLPLKILGDFYLKFNKPSRPTGIFDNEKDAIAWLKTFI